jgi:cyclopropane fatty-acyl-phospholipid synthase-like methyltransferase
MQPEYGPQAKEREQLDLWRQFVDGGNHPLDYGKEWGNPVTSPQLAPAYLSILRLKPGLRILEIGPGGGRWTRYLAGTKPFVLHGIEPSPYPRRHLTEYYGMHFPLCEDATCKLLEEYDVIFSYDVFVHFTEQTTMSYLELAAKRLKPCRGRFLLHFGARDQGSFVAMSEKCVNFLNKYFSLDSHLDVQWPIPEGNGSHFVAVTRNAITYPEAEMN